MVNIWTVIHKIGDKIIKVVEWPITHGAMLAHLLSDLKSDLPQLRTVLVGLVEKIGKLGPDALAAIADKGLKLNEDEQVWEDVQDLFVYIKDTFLPVLEKVYADFIQDTKASASDPSSPVPALQPAADAVAAVASKSLAPA